jgi:hypothetical protein
MGRMRRLFLNAVWSATGAPKVEIEVPENCRVATAHSGDGPGYFATFDEEVNRWCLENLLGAYGVRCGMAPNRIFSIRFICWFGKERDAVAFKLRWL